MPRSQVLLLNVVEARVNTVQCVGFDVEDSDDEFSQVSVHFSVSPDRRRFCSESSGH